MSNIQIILLAVLMLVLVFGAYIGIRVYLENEKERQKRLNRSLYNVKGVVEVEDELPKEGINYGDVYATLMPMHAYWVWCEGDKWVKLK